MSRLPKEFFEDRALRDAARKVLVADVEYARHALTGKSIAGRVTGRIGDGAKDVFEVAKNHATDRKGLLAGVIALIALWLARGPLMEILGVASEETENETDDIETQEVDAQDVDPQDETADGKRGVDSASADQTDDYEAASPDAPMAKGDTNEQTDAPEPHSIGETA